MAGTNLVVNGDFSQGNVGFVSQYSYQSDLVPEGTLFVDSEQHTHNPNWGASGQNDFPGYNGELNMLIVNGAGSPNVVVWSETVAVTPNTTYFFSTALASVYPTAPAVLDFSVNGTELGQPFAATSTVGQYQEFYSSWNSGNATSAKLGIVNQQTALAGNDFVLDDIVFSTDGTGGVNVPEPASLALLGIGLLGTAAVRRRRA